MRNMFALMALSLLCFMLFSCNSSTSSPSSNQALPNNPISFMGSWVRSTEQTINQVIYLDLDTLRFYNDSLFSRTYVTVRHDTVSINSISSVFGDKWYTINDSLILNPDNLPFPTHQYTIMAHFRKAYKYVLYPDSLLILDSSLVYKRVM
jgi:hypothetical protein